MSRSAPYGLLVGLVSAACFGFSGPLARALIDGGLTPMQAVWIRLGGAALVLLAVNLAFRPRALVVPRDKLGLIAAYTLIGFAAVQAFYYASVARLPVGIAVLLEYASPVIVVIWVRVVRRVDLPRTAALGSVLAVAGLACVVEVWHGVRLDGIGLLLGMGTAVTAAAYFLLTQRASEALEPLGAITWGVTGSTLALLPLAAPWSLPWGVLTDDLPLGGRAVPAPVVVACIILVATVAAYFTSLAAIRLLTVAVGATVASLEVVASALIAWVLLGQDLGPVQLAGGAIVLAGALLAQVSVVRLRSPDPPADAGPPAPSSDRPAAEFALKRRDA